MDARNARVAYARTPYKYHDSFYAIEYGRSSSTSPYLATYLRARGTIISSETTSVISVQKPATRSREMAGRETRRVRRARRYFVNARYNYCYRGTFASMSRHERGKAHARSRVSLSFLLVTTAHCSSYKSDPSRPTTFYFVAPINFPSRFSGFRIPWYDMVYRGQCIPFTWRRLLLRNSTSSSAKQ